MKIALDAMGGDFAPEATVEGALLAADELPSGSEVVLVGQQSVIENQLGGRQPSAGKLSICHAPDVIRMSEHPTKAFTQKPESSIAVGFGLLRRGDVQAFCSAGNTGAMHVGAIFSIRAIEGIIRPAIAGFAPKITGGHAVILDVGANAEVKPDVLAQFGHIGSLYARHVLNIERPRVALVNLGEEEEKGTLLTQAAYQLLKLNRHVNFVGNVEGRDLFRDKVDVIVCDGFTGNVILKLAEDFYDLLEEHHIFEQLEGKVDLDFFRNFNYEAVGGSPIIGVNGNVLIGHGVSSAMAIKNMCLQAARMAEAQIHLKIKKALSED
ncbi:phosphate acyltransferase PlsX [Catalinimonas alkaloidigena]|uniref:phosphate acyltransferase PlsX n=1 Tax=Catalinimonas alkaloidigena TaxID=1075417 RepID=UPI000B7EF9C5|nr:phosphate acyltransferase PlsX [Catalinimonas alkaloidigena]